MSVNQQLETAVYFRLPLLAESHQTDVASTQMGKSITDKPVSRSHSAIKSRFVSIISELFGSVESASDAFARSSRFHHWIFGVGLRIKKAETIETIKRNREIE